MAYNSLTATLWMFIIPLIAILLPVWLGQRYGLYLRKKNEQVREAPISTAVGATLGLFAFMLAFTFQIVGNKYDTRKQLLLDEISDIRTTFLYAGLVPEPIRSDARKLIINYVDIRVELMHNPAEFNDMRVKSARILDSLWKHSETLAAEDRSSAAYSLFISSVSELIGLFNQRISVTYQLGLPNAVVYVLSAVAFLSMITLGYQFGIFGNVNIIINLLLAVTFAVVMWLIFALDYPEAGLIPLSPDPMLALRDQLHSWR